MEQIISKKELDEFMKIKGEVRGVTLQGYKDYVQKEEGEGGLRKFNEVVEMFGYPKSIKIMSFYPVGFQVLVLEAMKRLFNYDEKKFQEVGRFQAKVSMVVRLFAKYFFSVKEIMKRAPRMWEKSYTFGDIETVEYSEEKKYLIIRINNFAIHPVHGQVLVGYFTSLLQMIGGVKPGGEEIKSPFKGDEYYEFLMKW